MNRVSRWGLASFKLSMGLAWPTPKTTVRLPECWTAQPQRLLCDVFVLAQTLPPNPPPAPPVSKVAVYVWGWFRFRGFSGWFRTSVPRSPNFRGNPA